MTIQRIAARARTIGPRCGALTVIAIDGPAGSGKTTLAHRLSEYRSAQILHMDDLYPGWEGLRPSGGIVHRILSTLEQGAVAEYQKYDWHAGAYREERAVHPQGTLIIEGVGSVRPEYQNLLSLIVMVTEVNPKERIRRGLARDGIESELHWRNWMEEESQLHQETNLEQIADIIVDGLGNIVTEN